MSKDEPVFQDFGRVYNEELYSGLTKREYFAGLAMHELSGEWAKDGRWVEGNLKKQAKLAVKWADALLAELDKDE